MGDRPYSAFLPWILFAVVARPHGDGVVWAAVCAVVSAGALLSMSHRPRSNILMRAAIPMFTIVGVLGYVFDSPSGWVAHNGRALSAFGLAIIALGSVAFTPVSDFYMRTLVRPRRWTTPDFLALNARLTLLWAGTAALIGTSHLVAARVQTPAALTTFNWVVPIVLALVGIHRSRELSEELLDADDESTLQSGLWDLSVEWPSRDF
jgi:hypothetical protein